MVTMVPPSPLPPASLLHTCSLGAAGFRLKTLPFLLSLTPTTLALPLHPHRPSSVQA